MSYQPDAAVCCKALVDRYDATYLLSGKLSIFTVRHELSEEVLLPNHVYSDAGVASRCAL